MSAQRYLFTDRRERHVNDAAANAAALAGDSTEEMLRELRSIDWAYPALFIYREADEDRWSQVMLGLSLKPELGEA